MDVHADALGHAGAPIGVLFGLVKEQKLEVCAKGTFEHRLFIRSRWAWHLWLLQNCDRRESNGPSGTPEALLRHLGAEGGHLDD